jgi:L-2,4-diaminobutyric acid acetyltransferase
MMTSLHEADWPGDFSGDLTRSVPIVRAPEAKDGALITELVRATRLLEPATGYAYVMMADMFGDTCAIAELEGVPVGCVIAFRPPRAPEALFVWQIGVHPRAQRRGVAHAMLNAILARQACAGVTELRATVAPSNAPSEAMFRAFAQRRGGQLERAGGYASDCFSEPHEAERLFRIRNVRATSAHHEP